MPTNYKTKICKQFSEEPFYCPYGEKCQFLHLSDPQKSEMKYTEILEVTTKQIENRLKDSSYLEEFEISNPVFKVSRLPIFKNLTDICEVEEGNSSDTEKSPLQEVPIAKKTSLKLKSRVFFMPKQASKDTPFNNTPLK